MSTFRVYDVDGNVIAIPITPILLHLSSTLAVTNGIAVEKRPISIPLAQVPSQQFTITLTNQPCRFKVYTKHIFVPRQTGNMLSDPPNYDPIDPVFVDLYINDRLVVGGMLGLNNNLIVRDAYFGFKGDLSFYDTEGESDPAGYEDLGTRWLLLYWPP